MSLENKLARKLVNLYRRLLMRQVSIQRSRAELGGDAFLSGHDGWFFHYALRRTNKRRPH
jgi:hypothetical protein